MAVKELKISILEDDGVEYGVPTEMDLLNAIRGIKFGGLTRYYIESDETLEIKTKESYSVSRDFFINGVVEITGSLGVL